MKNKENPAQKIAELSQNNVDLRAENLRWETKLKEVEKEVRGKLWLLFFLPLFGYFIYVAIIQRRRNSTYHEALVAVKTEIAKNELKIMINNKQIENLQTVSSSL